MPTDKDQLDNFIGHKLKHFRNKMKWPLKTLADKLCVSLQQLQKYEQGTTKLSASQLFRISRLLQISTEVFFEGYNEPKNEIDLDNQDYLQPSLQESFNVLVIEDSPEDDFLLRKALEGVQKKLSIYTIHDGQEALQFLKTLGTQGVSSLPKPDIIFLDLHLPHVRGLDILKDIKNRPLLQKTPVIVLTNSLSKKDMLEAYRQHSSGFVRKSFCFEEFKAHIQQAVYYWTQVVVLPEIE